MFKSKIFGEVSGSDSRKPKPSSSLSHTRHDSVVLPSSYSISPLDQLTKSLQEYSDQVPPCQPVPDVCEDVDLSSIKDMYEVIDAAKKLLRLTDRTIAKQREIMDELWIGMGRIIPNTQETKDKSLIVALIMKQADNLKLPNDVQQIIPLVRKLVAVIDL